MSAGIIKEVWDELKRHINVVEREEAAATLVSVLIDNDIDADEIKSTFKNDTEVKRAVASYLKDHEEDQDEEEFKKYWLPLFLSINFWSGQTLPKEVATVATQEQVEAPKDEELPEEETPVETQDDEELPDVEVEAEDETATTVGGREARGDGPLDLRRRGTKKSEVAFSHGGSPRTMSASSPRLRTTPADPCSRATRPYRR
jgi:hypothetical protein